MVCQVGPIQPAELSLIRSGAIVAGFHHLAVAPRATLERLRDLDATIIGFEIIEDERGDRPILLSISDLAGQLAIHEAAHLLQIHSGGRGILLGNTPGVPAATVLVLGAGSVGTVEMQFIDLPKPLALDCGSELHPIRVAYETYGVLSPARDNVILVCHALSGDAHAAGFTTTPVAASTRDGFRADERDAGSARGLGWWDGMIGPGKAFDTDQFFVVSTTLLGGCRGTTGPSSTNPATGRPYGSDFPVITVADMVRAQRALLGELGITRLAAVSGGSSSPASAPFG